RLQRRGIASDASDLAAAGQRPAERDLVGVLEVAADGQAAREAGHAYTSAEAVGEVCGGRLAGHVRVRGEDDLLHAVALDAADELVDAQVLGLDAVERRQRSAEHVVEAAVFGRPFERN